MNSVLRLCLVVMVFVIVAIAAPLQLRDVFVPPVTYPHAGTVWVVGQHHNVTWDTSNPPVNITNKVGQVVLAKNGLQDYKHPLASGFNILDGRVVIQVPHVEPGNDYTIVLFGDSGNSSPEFTISK